MPVITMEEAQDWPTLPAESVIGVRVESHEIEEREGRHGPWQKINFEFKITQVPGDEYSSLVGTRIWGGIPFRFNDSEDNPLKRWTEALLGMELSVGFQLDTEMLNGRECRAIVRTYEKRNGGTNHAVDELLPKGTATPQAPQPVQSPASSFGTVQQPAASLVEDEIPF